MASPLTPRRHACRRVDSAALQRGDASLRRPPETMQPVQRCDESALKRCGACIATACPRTDNSSCEDDGRANLVGGEGRTVSGTVKAAPKVGGPVHGAGHDLGWTRALRPQCGLFFCLAPQTNFRGPFTTPGGDALSP